MDLGIAAKQTLKAYVPLLDERIGKYLDRELSLRFGFNNRQKQLVRDILEHSREYILRPTKRLRGSFVNYGYRLSGKPAGEKVWQAVVAVELVHAALLMHDDFMDLDNIRRQGPTTHKYFEKKYQGNEHFGHAMAVSVGDALLCLGFELLADCGNAAAIKHMLRSITNTAYGQAYDMSLGNLGKWTEEDVITLHKAKTAIYTYENPLFIGAYLAGLNDEVLEILRDYSMDGGVAFQLRDDILGVFGDPAETGKSANSDLLQGKVTLLVLYVFQHGSTAQKKILGKVWGKRAAKESDIVAVKKVIKDSGAYDYSLGKTRYYAGKAVQTAEKLRKLDLDSEAIDYIQGIAQYMIERGA